MSDESARARNFTRNVDSLRKEAKRWHHALESTENAAANRSAHERLAKIVASPPLAPTLRDVQHALAREQGFAGWTELKAALAPNAATSGKALDAYEQKAQALLNAYQLGTPEALERHYALTWHRREWHVMRSYIQLDLGKRPAHADDDVAISLDDARYLIAIEHGFESWRELVTTTSRLPGGIPMAANPVRVQRGNSEQTKPLITSRDWNAVLELLAEYPDATLGANGQMTDEILERVSCIDGLTSLSLGNSKALTDVGIKHLSGVRTLRELDLSSTGITDAGLRILNELPALESLSLVMTNVTDAGLENVRACEQLKRLNLMWTRTGDGALRALAGKEHLTHFSSGNLLSDDGLALLHELPVFKTWRNESSRTSLLSHEAEPNQLVLRGFISDNGLNKLRGLDGVFGLNLDDQRLNVSARGMAPLVSLPHLGFLSVDAKDDWMQYIARMPALQFLSAQDTTASDDGWVALARSQTIERIWGRRSHNLRDRGFSALATMPMLCGLSVSCLNVSDSAIALLPEFPALRELMPMDIPDAGYQHIGRCANLEALVLMYCRDTTDKATEGITELSKLKRYFNSYTTITDRTPEILSHMQSLESLTFDACNNLTNNGIANLVRLPRLRELRISGNGLTKDVIQAFPAGVTVHYSH